MRKLLLVSMVLFCATIFGQSQYSVILQSGNYELDEKKFDQKLKYKSSEIVDDHFIRLVQFYQVPTQKEQDLLTNSGAKLLGYLPKNTFLIAFPEGYILNDNNVRAVAPFTGPMKLSRKLAMGTIPEYAIIGDKERILVQFYTHLNNHSIKGYANEMMKIAPGQYTLKGSHQLEIIIEPNKWQALAELPFLAYVQEGEDPGEIENYKARSSHRVDAIGLTTDNTYKLDGSGVMISLGDVNSGPMLDSHIDFEGRLTDLGTGNNNSDHGNHTTGTAFGAGNLDPDGAGMAPGADLRYYTYPSNLNNADADYVNHAVRITSSSFSNGCNTYTSFSAQVDKDMYDNRSLVHVFSAGNNNNNNCGYGAGSQWGNITGGHKQGKNVIAVANMTSGDGISGSSSRGPAHDGRVKPDIGGVGTSVYSTLNNNTYGSKSGTSMSCPGIAGTLSLIYQGYKQHNNGTDPDGGLAKALLMNTADDVGNKHVDYIYGYGRVNAYRAMECIEAGNIIIDSVSTTGSNTHTINVPAGTKAVRVMLHWTDKEAFPFAGRALVNDLDMVVTHSNTNTSYLPWVLDPTPNAGALNSVAVRAVDSLNNTEQFTLESPATGDYTIQISGNAVPNGPQRYYVVYSFVTEDLELRAPFGGEVWNPTKNYNIRWQTTDQLGGNSTLQYSLDNGATWTNIVNGLPASLKNYNWNIPNSIASSRVKVRVIRGNDTATSKSFGILRTPTGLTVDWICPDSTQISFNSVPGAIGYVAHRLGTKYMDSVGTSTTTTIRFATANLSAGNWYSVSALDSAGRKSERAIAIRRNAGTLNCVLPNDLEMVQIISPASGNLKDCLGVDSMDVVIRVKNTGQNDLDTIPLNY
ncbi:MAG: S8 family serine peptidase, partial [Schleiferiaceae bacterium]|nr:S8 family serine peptidase [Schleiferiaceae bacterium]